LIALHLSHLGFLKPIARGDTPLLRVGRAILKSEGGGRVFTTSLVNVPEVELLPNTKKAVALDVGVEKLLVTSDTEYFPNAVILGKLRDLIKYQVQKYSKRFLLVNPANTSKTCAKCGHVREDLTLTGLVSTYPECGSTAERDYNASPKVLKRSGMERPVEPVEPTLHPWPRGEVGP